MGEGRANTNRRSRQIVEPTDNEKAAVKAARTFGRVFSKDSTALGVAAFALFFFIVFAIVVVTLVGGVARNECGGRDVMWLAVIGAFLFAVFAVLVAVAVLVARYHYLHPDKSDVFAADGRLFHTWFLRDKEYKDGRGIVRINVVGIAECAGFHNRKTGRSGFSRTPMRASTTCGGAASGGRTSATCASPSWRRGCQAARARTRSLAWTSSTGGFLERIGVKIEETTEPVAFLAGTWSLVDDCLHG